MQGVCDSQQAEDGCLFIVDVAGMVAARTSTLSTSPPRIDLFRRVISSRPMPITGVPPHGCGKHSKSLIGIPSATISKLVRGG